MAMWVALKDDDGIRPDPEAVEDDSDDVGMVPASRLGGPFVMVDGRTGKLTNDRAVFHGRWSLLYFGFTHCAEICPKNMRFMSTVIDTCVAKSFELPSAVAAPMRVCFISIDPIRDGPAQMSRFLDRFTRNDALGATGDSKIRAESHCGLVGDEAQVGAAARAWRVFFSSFAETVEEVAERERRGYSSLRDAIKDDDSYQFDHSAAIYLVGPDGKARDLFFEAMPPDAVAERVLSHMTDAYGIS